MPVFTIETPEGRKLKIDAPDEATAIRGAQNWSLQNRKRTAVDEVTGALANFNRGTALGDELAAAGGVVSGLLTGRHRFGADRPGNVVANNLAMLREAYENELAGQRGREGDFASRRPRAAALARGTGTAATVALPTPGATAGIFAQGTRLANAGRGAVTAGLTGAAYAAADEGTAAERLAKASKAGWDPLTMALGAGAGALAPAVRPSSKPKPRTPQRVLSEAGVSLTPGQKAGGLAKSAEDLGQRAPILGPAIRGARQRGVESLNRAYANKALEPIGDAIPANLPAGQKSVEYVATRLGREYDEAAAMVPRVDFDDEFKGALSAIDGQLAEYGDDVARQFRTTLKNRLFSRVGANGADDLAQPITGTMLREIQSDIGKQAAKFSASDDVAQQGLGDALETVSDELKNLLARTSPEAGRRIGPANQGWSLYVRLRNAASKAKGGIATPGQFRTAVRVMDRSVGKGNVAQGKAIGQDLADAASEIMPDTFGNPGTADAVGLGALGLGMVTGQPAAWGTAAGLTAAATPYALMGRQIMERLPANATRAQLMNAAAQLRKLAPQDPAVADMYRQVAARLAIGAGAAGGLSVSQGASNQ